MTDAETAQVEEQIEEMWADHESDAEWQDYLWSTYRGQLPADEIRFTRNDPEADYEELFESED